MVNCLNYLLQLLVNIIDYYFNTFVFNVSDTLTISLGDIMLYVSIISVLLFIILHRFSAVSARNTRPRITNVTNVEHQNIDNFNVRK